MAKASRDKGKRGEREVAQLLTDYGITSRRGRQFKGTPESPDVDCGIPWLNVEVKRREATNVYTWMAEAKATCKHNQMPVVFHKKNDLPTEHRPWLTTMLSTDFAVLMKVIQTLEVIYGVEIKYQGKDTTVNRLPDSGPDSGINPDPNNDEDHE